MLNNSSRENDLENSIVLNVNLDALKKLASNVFQVQCISIQEFNEGGFHKVYILKMEDGKEYIGRVAFPVYPQWKTESEVAVMEYIHLYTNIPVPKVYYWNSSVNNPVGAEYILMEYLPGIQLKKLTFSKIGCIFFDKNGFKIGQVIECNFFTGERVTLPTMELGSFNTTEEYILAVIQNQIHYYRAFKSKDSWIPKYEELCKLVPKYFQNGNDTFVLTHGDFHSSNILVNNDEITGINDWECSGAFLVEFLCTYPIWITENPTIEPVNKVSKDNLMLQKFFRDEIQGVWKVDDFLDKFET
ncbi:1060_t:CDS:2, partial [Dentiscutata heterogama]